MNKSEFLKAVEQAVEDDSLEVVTLIVKDEQLYFIGNMPWANFEDIILDLAENILKRVKETGTIH
jgi:hypothetical protein